MNTPELETAVGNNFFFKQRNNAVARINLDTNLVSTIYPLGNRSWNSYYLDPSDYDLGKMGDHTANARGNITVNMTPNWKKKPCITYLDIDIIYSKRQGKMDVVAGSISMFFTQTPVFCQVWTWGATTRTPRIRPDRWGGLYRTTQSGSSLWMQVSSTKFQSTSTPTGDAARSLSNEAVSACCPPGFRFRCSVLW